MKRKTKLGLQLPIYDTNPIQNKAQVQKVKVAFRDRCPNPGAQSMLTRKTACNDVCRPTKAKDHVSRAQRQTKQDFFFPCCTNACSTARFSAHQLTRIPLCSPQNPCLQLFKKFEFVQEVQVATVLGNPESSTFCGV